MAVERIREMPPSPTGATSVLVKKDGRYFIVSSAHAPYSGFETLVFPADAQGTVTDWLEVAGGRGYVRDEAIAALDATDLTARDTEADAEEE